MTMRFDILTIFPNFFSGPLDHGVLSRAIATGTVQVATHDLRAFTHDRHRTVDDRPFGGGEGMVLKPQPIFECIESLGAASNPNDIIKSADNNPLYQLDGSYTKSNKPIDWIAPKSTRDLARQSVILLSAQGRPFTQSTAHRLATLDRVALICGRYESFGVADLLPGDPADGKTPDGVPRSTHGAGGILDYPQYTRPADFRGTSIPEVLAAGDHASIRRWRRQMALAKTLRNRPDLLARAPLTPEDREVLASLGHKFL
jgi:tRNA (guanine37-N1)-methyltransferase